MPEAETDELKRHKILEGTRNIFFREGISALTMDRIAALLGISKKTLYKYFSNKADLVEAAVEERIQEIAAEVRSIVEQRSLPFPRRIGLILGIVSRQLALLGDRILNDMAYREPELWQKIDRFRREQIFGAFSKLVREGVDSGYVRADIQVDLIPVLFVSSIAGVLNPPQLLSLPTPPAVIFQTVARVLMGGILTEEGRAQITLAEPAFPTEVER